MTTADHDTTILGHTLSETRPYAGESSITLRRCTRCGLHLYESADGRGGYAVTRRCTASEAPTDRQPAKSGGML